MREDAAIDARPDGFQGIGCPGINDLSGQHREIELLGQASGGGPNDHRDYRAGSAVKR